MLKTPSGGAAPGRATALNLDRKPPAPMEGVPPSRDREVAGTLDRRGRPVARKEKGAAPAPPRAKARASPGAAPAKKASPRDPRKTAPMPHTEFLTGRDLYERVIGDLLPSARDSLLVATAPLKATRLVRPDGTVESVVRLLARLGRRGVAVRVLHAGVPSGPFLEELRAVEPGLFQMRRCPRTHFKAAVVDGRRLYLGSANLTGAGLGAKSPERRNFEVGLLSDDPALVDAVADLFEAVWSGAMCPTCGRRDHCPVPLEEPWEG